MSITLLTSASLLQSPLFAQSAAKYINGKIERLHPGLDAIIDTNGKIEVIADGFKWVEGPVWVESQQMLLVSDVPNNKIYKWTAQRGKELYLEPSGYTGNKPRGGEMGSNGLTLTAEGKLVVCQHGDRRVAVMDVPVNSPKPVFTSLATNYKGKKFDSPNDVVIKSNGDTYFTDPPYGLEKNVKDSSKQAPYQGVYKIAKNGSVTLLVDTITRPNGIAFFPDEKRLLIANSDAKKPYWYVYDVDRNGNLANGRIFFNAARYTKNDFRMPDGLKIDKNGNVFSSGPGGFWIFNKHGEVLGRFINDAITSNCAFSSDEKTLFITANDKILKIDLK
ncbi:SMP-30/gluconolactonase/LRE family protein [Mucilaginibacter hurinus]|uniref:SMP-30/gluconolactonase/LRE family protein n=1 Tax=Mucilaginibacter hurinus TaxID=2201324 RepID=UPI0018F4AF38|nr:SMP-30/gluconolactonase/LRE family protein [Mucilaginibacter hurinus]